MARNLSIGFDNIREIREQGQVEFHLQSDFRRGS